MPQQHVITKFSIVFLLLILPQYFVDFSNLNSAESALSVFEVIIEQLEVCRLLINCFDRAAKFLIVLI